jgi:hypothetical protein
MRTTTTSSKHRPLLLEGMLSLSGPNGEEIQVRGAGKRIELVVDRSFLTFSMLKRLPRRSQRRRWLLTGQPTLELAGIHIDILVDGRPVAHYDATSTGSVLTRLLGFGPLRLNLRELLRLLAPRLSRRDDP